MAGDTPDKGTEQVNAYVYRCLPDDQSIRMLTLHPGKPDDPLTGDLGFVNIESTGVYEPLSYVWGDSGAKYSILIGTAELKITTSLYYALKRLRLRGEPRRLWADQVCINQKDSDERSEQVKFMNMIYKNASHVLVWLGVDEEELAEPAFHLIHKLNKVLKDEEQYQKLDVQYVKELEDQIERERTALDRLTDLPWVCSSPAMHAQTPTKHSLFSLHEGGSFKR